MKRFLFSVALMWGMLAQAQASEDVWKPFRFLIGSWAGVGSGEPGKGVGEFSLQPELNDQILVRRNLNRYAPQAGGAEATHEDLLIIYSEKGAYRGEYFDNEGHVIHYKVSPSENALQFLSDGPSTAARFKLVYEKKDDGVEISFAIAPPNGDFRPYLNSVVRRK